MLLILLLQNDLMLSVQASCILYESTLGKRLEAMLRRAGWYTARVKATVLRVGCSFRALLAKTCDAFLDVNLSNVNTIFEGGLMVGVFAYGSDASPERIRNYAHHALLEVVHLHSKIARLHSKEVVQTALLPLIRHFFASLAAHLQRIPLPLGALGYLQLAMEVAFFREALRGRLGGETADSLAGPILAFLEANTAAPCSPGARKSVEGILAEALRNSSVLLLG